MTNWKFLLHKRGKLIIHNFIEFFRWFYELSHSTLFRNTSKIIPWHTPWAFLSYVFGCASICFPLAELTVWSEWFPDEIPATPSQVLAVHYIAVNRGKNATLIRPEIYDDDWLFTHISISRCSSNCSFCSYLRKIWSTKFDDCSMFLGSGAVWPTAINDNSRRTIRPNASSKNYTSECVCCVRCALFTLPVAMHYKSMHCSSMVMSKGRQCIYNDVEGF